MQGARKCGKVQCEGLLEGREDDERRFIIENAAVVVLDALIILITRAINNTLLTIHHSYLTMFSFRPTSTTARQSLLQPPHLSTSRGAIDSALFKSGQRAPLLTGGALKPLIIYSGGLLKEKNKEEVSRWKMKLGKVGEEQPLAKMFPVLQMIR